MNRDLAERLFDRAIEDAGFTFSIQEDRFLDTGYVVATEGHECIVTALTIGAIADFIEDNRARLADHGICVGAWWNATADAWYLDLSLVVPTLDDAIAAGRRNNQIAVYDLENQESILVDYMTQGVGNVKE